LALSPRPNRFCQRNHPHQPPPHNHLERKRIRKGITSPTYTFFLYALSHRTRPENRCKDQEKERNVGSLATFLITLLLQALLVTPVDTGPTSIVNSFHAAAATPLPCCNPPKGSSSWGKASILYEASLSYTISNVL